MSILVLLKHIIDSFPMVSSRKKIRSHYKIVYTHALHYSRKIIEQFNLAIIKIRDCRKNRHSVKNLCVYLYFRPNLVLPEKWRLFF